MVSRRQPRHVELMFNPQYFYPNAVTYRTMVDGLIEGIAARARDFGVSEGLLIAAIDRQIDPSAALEISITCSPIGVTRWSASGSMARNVPVRRAPFHELYRRAGAAGLCAPPMCARIIRPSPRRRQELRGAAAMCSSVIASITATTCCRSTRWCDGARRRCLFFNTCTITSVRRNLARATASIARMVEAGLRMTLDTDDPAMFRVPTSATPTASCCAPRLGSRSGAAIEPCRGRGLLARPIGRARQVAARV